jgi:Acyl-protein synthetase, LuxE
MDISTLNIQQIVHASSAQFEQMALEVFRYQAAHNSIYRDYLRLLNVAPQLVQSTLEIPYLPISFFKTHTVQTGHWQPETHFTSSGTTGQQPSQHAVRSLANYLTHCQLAFESSYGPLKDWCILGLLPSYLERSGSGLIAMVEGFMKISAHPNAGYYLHNHEALFAQLQRAEKAGQKTLLIGVTFALLDFVQCYQLPLRSTVVMETGGMKGRGPERTRSEVHHLLQQAFDTAHIHSEYGMTELSSQAYSSGHGLFRPGPGMRVLIRETTDPLSCMPQGAGGLNIIDLANAATCSFIATEDLGRVHSDGTFEVVGRYDQSEARGCNLMVV